jgi:hypothetical protein
MQYPQSTARRSWWHRNWKWFVPVGVLALLLSCVGAPTLFVVSVFGIMKSSAAYTESLALVQADPEVREAIGSPVQAGLLVGGNISVEGSSGRADLLYPVSGPEGEAQVYVVAEKSSGQWTFTQLIVEIESTGETIELHELALGSAE